jgi:hypothetical protein
MKYLSSQNSAIGISFGDGPDLPWNVMAFCPGKLQLQRSHCFITEEHERLLEELAEKLAAGLEAVLACLRKS